MALCSWAGFHCLDVHSRPGFVGTRFTLYPNERRSESTGKPNFFESHRFVGLSISILIVRSSPTYLLSNWNYVPLPFEAFFPRGPPTGSGGTRTNVREPAAIFPRWLAHFTPTIRSVGIRQRLYRSHVPASYQQRNKDKPKEGRKDLSSSYNSNISSTIQQLLSSMYQTSHTAIWPKIRSPTKLPLTSEEQMACC